MEYKDTWPYRASSRSSMGYFLRLWGEFNLSSDILEVSLSAKHNTKITSSTEVLELVSNTQGIVSHYFRRQGCTEKQWGV